MKHFSSTLTSLNKPVGELSHDELSLRYYLSRTCPHIAFMRDGEQGFMAHIVQRPERHSPARVQAARILASACQGVPSAMLGDAAESELLTEMIRRGDHPVARLTMLPANHLFHPNNNEFRKLTESGDALAFSSALALLREDAVIVVDEPVTSDDFRKAWAIALCELAEGCGADSQPLLESCVLFNRCGAGSLLEAAKLYEPERYPMMAKLYPRLVTALVSGNWGALDWRKARLDVRLVASEPIK